MPKHTHLHKLYMNTITDRHKYGGIYAKEKLSKLIIIFLIVLVILKIITDILIMHHTAFMRKYHSKQ